MKISYNDTDITDMVQVKSCTVHDTCEDRCDSMELVFEDAAGWYRWDPQEDDLIEIEKDGYISGTMYVHSILPEDGKYTIMASALPCKSREKSNKSFTDKTLENILKECAYASYMDYHMYGMNNPTIRYIQKVNEGNAAFISRLCELEGAVLKCLEGKFTVLNLQYLQGMEAAKTVTLESGQDGFLYEKNGVTYKSLTVQNAAIKSTATDTSVPETHMSITSLQPVHDEVQAGRWAKGLLISHNRKAETLKLQTTFNPSAYAMVRFDVDGDTPANGKWLIQDVFHDILADKSIIKMHRCIETIL